QRAQVIVLFPILILVVLGMGAISIDTGRLLLARQEMQKAAEAAALAGALAIAPIADQSKAAQQGAATTAVSQSIGTNMGVADTVCETSLATNVSVTSVLVNTVPLNAVQVSISCNARWIAGSVLGGHLSIPQLQANAAAVVGSSDASHNLRQFVQGLPPYALVLNNDDLK